MGPRDFGRSAAGGRCTVIRMPDVLTHSAVQTTNRQERQTRQRKMPHLHRAADGVILCI